jgi:flagellar protein FliO/FliZ
VLASMFGSGLPTYVQGIILAVILFVVFVGLLLVWRSVRSGAGRATGQGASRARQPRLGVVDVFDLDRQRQLILLRRDNVEHLVMIGGPNDVVVEQQIMRGAAARTTPSVEAILEKALQADDAPEPHHVAEVRPTEPRQDPRHQEQRQEPRQEPRQPPKQPARGATTPGQAPQRNAPRPGDETVLNDMTRQLEEALKKPFAPAQDGEPPPLPQRRDPALQAPPMQAKNPSSNNPANNAGNVDLGQGPARAAVPPPRQPAQAPDRAPPQPAMVRAMPPPPRPELVKEPVKESAKEPPRELPKEPPKEPFKPPMAEAKPEGNGQVPKQGALPKAEPVNAEMARPQQPVKEPVKVEPPHPPQVPPSVVSAEQKDLDPFSPEAIEAEFARLLGRLPSKSSG